MKKLYKSTRDVKINGVCAGIADYFDADATIIRLIFAVSIIFGGAGIWAYIICMILMPQQPIE